MPSIVVQDGVIKGVVPLDAVGEPAGQEVPIRDYVADATADCRDDSSRRSSLIRAVQTLAAHHVFETEGNDYLLRFGRDDTIQLFRGDTRVGELDADEAKRALKEGLSFEGIPLAQIVAQTKVYDALVEQTLACLDAPEPGRNWLPGAASSRTMAAAAFSVAAILFLLYSGHSFLKKTGIISPYQSAWTANHTDRVGSKAALDEYIATARAILSQNEPDTISQDQYFFICQQVPRLKEKKADGKKVGELEALLKQIEQRQTPQKGRTR